MTDSHAAVSAAAATRNRASAWSASLSGTAVSAGHFSAARVLVATQCGPRRCSHECSKAARSSAVAASASKYPHSPAASSCPSAR